jgi:TonB family protein
MPEPALGLKSSRSQQHSFFRRIRENFESVWKLPRTSLQLSLSANGAPIHLLDEPRRGNFAAQAGSMGLHVLFFAVLSLLLARPLLKTKPGAGPDSIPLEKLLYRAAMPARTDAAGSLGRSGNSGGRDSLPPTGGEFLPLSIIVLAPPRLPNGRTHLLSVQSAVFDADAPEFSPPVKDPGLPWMKEKNGSNGPGQHGIGTGDKNGMGDGPGDGVGVGSELGTYANVVSQVVCKICPDPLYSDEARKQKLQGRVVLRVLVGTDGRAKDVQVTRGLGMGLDENAMSAVRNWQFIPAKDANRHSMASWITIETVFRLF